MSGGDTLIIGNGTYTGTANETFTYGGARTPPTGSSSQYTTIRAENNGGVLFDGQNTLNDMFYYQPGTSGSHSAQYVTFQGLTWARSSDSNMGGVVSLAYASYVKFLQCGAYDPEAGNSAGFEAYGCDHILYEGCYAYGLGRYKFITYAASQYIIFRNCVARHDAVDEGGLGWPMGGFSVYDSSDILVQNSIVIDSDQPSAYLLDGVGPGQYGGCFDVFTTSAAANDVMFTNSICLKSRMGGAFVARDNFGY